MYSLLTLLFPLQCPHSHQLGLQTHLLCIRFSLRVTPTLGPPGSHIEDLSHLVIVARLREFSLDVVVPEAEATTTTSFSPIGPKPIPVLLRGWQLPWQEELLFFLLGCLPPQLLLQILRVKSEEREERENREHKVAPPPKKIGSPI